MRRSMHIEWNAVSAYERLGTSILERGSLLDKTDGTFRESCGCTKDHFYS